MRFALRKMKQHRDETRMNEAVRNAAPAAGPAFNPLSPDFIRNPYPFYEYLRANAPMMKTPIGAYLVSRHADVSLVLRDRRFGKDFAGRTIARYGESSSLLLPPLLLPILYWPPKTSLMGEEHRCTGRQGHPLTCKPWHSHLRGDTAPTSLLGGGEDGEKSNVC